MSTTEQKIHKGWRQAVKDPHHLRFLFIFLPLVIGALLCLLLFAFHPQSHGLYQQSHRLLRSGLQLLTHSCGLTACFTTSYATLPAPSTILPILFAPSALRARAPAAQPRRIRRRDIQVFTDACLGSATRGAYNTCEAIGADLGTTLNVGLGVRSSPARSIAHRFANASIQQVGGEPVLLRIQSVLFVATRTES